MHKEPLHVVAPFARNVYIVFVVTPCMFLFAPISIGTLSTPEGQPTTVTLPSVFLQGLGSRAQTKGLELVHLPFPGEVCD
jgi:hypothetical protein